MSKRDELLATIKAANKSLGTNGKIYTGDEHPEYSRLSTGILSLDVITGGGIPKGAMTEFYGPESSGKTLACLHTAAETQRQKGTVVWIAREGMDKNWAQKQGIDLKNIFLIDTQYGDTALETGMTLVESGNVDLFVIDSIQAFGTEREAEGGLEAESYGGGGSGQLWGRVMRRAYAAQARGGQNTAVLCISQVRSAIGKRGFKGAAPDPEPSGIWAVKHWKSVSIQFKKGDYEVDGKDKEEEKRIVSQQFKMNCKKNKTAAPGRTGHFTYNFEGPNQGIDHLDEVLRLGKATEVIVSKGAWLETHVGKDFRSQGGEAFLEELRKDPKFAAAIKKEIIKYYQ